MMSSVKQVGGNPPSEGSEVVVGEVREDISKDITERGSVLGG